MRVLVVDDEALARERLCALLQRLGDQTVVGEADSGEACLDRVNALQPDVVLLDIRMPGMEGLETARHLAALDAPPAVIFVTAYDAFAIDAFEAQAVDYLLKPVRLERLAAALGRATRPTRPQLAALTGPMGTRRQRIAARLGEAVRLIPVDGIRWFQADQKYVTVHHADGTDIIDDSLKDLEREFAADFVRIHRNALVALRHVAAVERDARGQLVVQVDGVAKGLAVSRRHARELRRRIQSG